MLYQINLIPLGRCGFLTAPFCINISNNAKDENISVRSRAIHSTSYIQNIIHLCNEILFFRNGITIQIVNILT